MCLWVHSLHLHMVSLSMWTLKSILCRTSKSLIDDFFPAIFPIHHFYSNLVRFSLCSTPFLLLPYFLGDNFNCLGLISICIFLISNSICFYGCSSFVLKNSTLFLFHDRSILSLININRYLFSGCFYLFVYECVHMYVYVCLEPFFTCLIKCSYLSWEIRWMIGNFRVFWLNIDEAGPLAHTLTSILPVVLQFGNLFDYL